MLAPQLKPGPLPPHNGLPVHGYQPQSDAKIAIVNGFKEMEERLLRVVDSMSDDQSAAEALGWPGSYDARWVSIAKTHFEQGFMALNRAVFQPQRISLPEDAPAEAAE